MNGKKLIPLLTSIGLVIALALAIVPTGGATVAQAEKTYNCLNPQSGPPRILFTGTLLDAQEFYQQTTIVPAASNSPIAKYTDGLPIVIPTEEAVREVLTGTTHQPDELIHS